MTTGLCRNQQCPNGQSAVRVERYPGPGEYCPECGNLLADALPSQAGPQRKTLIAVGGALAAVVTAVAVIRAMAIGGPGETIRVCRSSMTERFASDVVRAYAARSRTPASRFASSTTDCDVRFAAARTAGSQGLIGHDGIVAVVNPQNPVAQLTEQQLRMIFTGDITDWSQLGGSAGRIVPILTADDSDESRAIMAGLLRGRDLAPNIGRAGTSTDVVRRVTGGSGRRSIGLVAFSAAVHGKVVRLAALPVPSARSIGEHRYPLTVTVTVAAEHPTHGSAPAGLAEYAQSDAAKAIAMRDGIIPKKGF